MNFYFFLFVQNFALHQINIKIYDKIKLLHMCGRNEGPSSIESNYLADPKMPPSTTSAQLAVEAMAYSGRKSNVKVEVKDHIDRGIGVKDLDRFYILTYMSPPQMEQHVKGSGNMHGRNINPSADEDDMTTQSERLSSSSSSSSSSSRSSSSSSQSLSSLFSSSSTSSNSDKSTFFKTTLITERIIKKSTRSSLFRKRRDAIAIPGSKDKDSISQSTPTCSCTITTAHNFTIYILHVQGPRPEKTRMHINPTTSPGYENSFSLDVGNFWGNHYSKAADWRQMQRAAKVTITIEELQKPTSTNMLMLGVSGSYDLDVDCMSKPILLKEIRVPKETNTAVPAESTDQESALIKPFFLGAVAVLVFALIIMGTGLALWKRSRANLRMANKNKMKQVTGQRYVKKDEVYEEIPDENISRSGSKTRLGTLSLTSVRGQHSPVLNPHRKKNSLDRTAILTTMAHTPSNIININNSNINNNNDNDDLSRNTSNTMPKDSYALYEELPESSLYHQSGDRPPPKPFLDRKSLMIKRSQSTPISYQSSSSDSDNEQQQRVVNKHRKIKSSHSYSEDRSARIDRDVGEEILLKTIGYQNNPNQSQTANQSNTNQRPLQRQKAHGSSQEFCASSNKDDNNAEELIKENSCDCGRNDADETYVEIDCQRCHNKDTGKKAMADVHEVETHGSTTKNVVANRIAENIVADLIDPEIKPRTVFSHVHDEELVMFDNIIYMPST